MKGFVVALLIFSLACSFASAYDPDPLQDICVAIDDPLNGVFVNGRFCKSPNITVADDFFFSGLHIPRNTDNRNGVNATVLNVDQIPGLNTLGITLTRVDYAPNGGVNPPHIHPRATEITVVIKGILYVGFVTTTPSQLFWKVLHRGDVFVFPKSLIHFQLNIANTNAVAITALNSQNPGIIFIADALFGPTGGPIDPDVLAKAFQLDRSVIEQLQSVFGGAR
ncbi:germin-like protein subfamily 1 member 20 [Mercurialis annua]|uniref:germin-like protein subfamily 1 member 20 n=1 Tax=Mercurialis annua TaxID=3986 RepID=UPI00215F897C|nr:germin-like protein subfamily 1 member 20 [Mercurialis annua]